MARKKKAGRPKGSTNKKISKPDKSDLVVMALQEELEDKNEEIRGLEESIENVKPPIQRMQDFQDKALGYLFAIALIALIFIYLGAV